MKHAASLLPLALIAAGLVLPAQAQQNRIYRCGNTYTNNATEAQANKNCKLVEGGNVTVVEGVKSGGAGGGTKVATAGQAAPKSDPEKAARESDMRAILEAELKKAEAKQAELAKEYNGGQPEKQGDEARNYQKYLDRVAALKESITRNENDIAGIKRELGRLPAK